MKTRTYCLATGAALVAIALGASVASLNARESESEQHTEIERSIVLAPAASALSNAIGFAKMEVGDSRGGTNRIEINTSGLPAGMYLVNVFDRSGSNSAVLGSITVGTNVTDDNSAEDNSARSGGVDDGAEHHSGSDNGTPAATDDGTGSVTDDNGHHQRGRDAASRGRDSHHDEGETRFPLPGTIGAFDIGRISITSLDGTEMLAGDFSDVSTTVAGQVAVTVPAMAGADDPDASGVAAIKGHVRRGRGSAVLSVVAKNLPPRATVHMLVNGEDAGTARTDRHGGLRVRRTHRVLNVFAISTVSIRDDAGHEILTAHF